MVIAMRDSADYDGSDWVFDSGESRRLVEDDNCSTTRLLASQEIAMSGIKTLFLTRVDSLRLELTARCVESRIVITYVYLTPILEKSIVSYGKLKKRYLFLRTTGRRARSLGVSMVTSHSTLCWETTFCTPKRQRKRIDTVQTTSLWLLSN